MGFCFEPRINQGTSQRMLPPTRHPHVNQGHQGWSRTFQAQAIRRIPRSLGQCLCRLLRVIPQPDGVLHTDPSEKRFRASPNSRHGRPNVGTKSGRRSNQRHGRIHRARMERPWAQLLGKPTSRQPGGQKPGSRAVRRTFEVNNQTATRSAHIGGTQIAMSLRAK